MTNRFSIPAPGPGIPDHCDPADANTSWAWIKEVLVPLGLAVVVVEAETNPQQCDWLHVGEPVGTKLTEADLGGFDSYKYGHPARWFFLVPAKRLAEALQLVKRELAALKLLDQAKIGHAEPETQTWRTFL